MFLSISNATPLNWIIWLIIALLILAGIYFLIHYTVVSIFLYFKNKHKK